MAGDACGVWPGVGTWTHPGEQVGRTVRPAPRTPLRMSVRELDEAGLVAACLDGHREAFEVLVERHQRQIYLLCYRFVGNHEDASELAQDVFVRAYRGLSGFKRQSSLSTWLYRIGVNVCLNRLATTKPPSEPLDARKLADTRGEDPAERAIRAERVARVRAAIAKLPNRQRAALVLRVYHELSHQEIAEVLDSTAGAVKANVFHALGNLKKILGGTP
jgi:RNA polymerase sigma-70 factor (ECF subfamily)